MLAAWLGVAFCIRVAGILLAYYPTIDSGTVGLMACHILEGERPLFFSGQQYMGALEAYVAAFFVSWMGPSILAVSLSPILFSLGWIVAVWMLVRELYGLRAAHAAAAIAAVPPWHVLWYSIGTYGGYPATWFFAAFGLWLVIREWKTGPGGPGTALRFTGLGICSGLGVWTNPQSVMVLAVGWTTATVYALKHRACARSLIVPAFLCMLSAAVTALPVILAALRGADSGMMTAWSFSPPILLERAESFLLAGLFILTWSREEMHAAWTLLVGLCIATGGFLLLLSLLRSPAGKEVLRKLAPALVLASCTLFVLPHNMADEQAPRYLVLPWTTLAVWIFAVPISGEFIWVRRAATMVLVCWIALQMAGITMISKAKQPHRAKAMQSRQEIVDTSYALDHPYTSLVGGEIFGHRSQPWNFHGAGRTRFVSSFDERTRRTSEEAERAENYALACEPHLGGKLASTLADLDVSFSKAESENLWFFHDLKVPVRPAKSIRPDQATLREGGESKPVLEMLFDRHAYTTVSAGYTEEAVIDLDLGTERSLDSLTIFSPHWFHDDLPTSFQVEYSTEGENYELFKDVTNRFSVAYRESGRVYVKGYFGCLETSLRGLTARFLRFRPRTGASAFPAWTMSELYVFESTSPLGQTGTKAGLPAIIHAAETNDLDFIYANRSQSALLSARLAHTGTSHVYPRYNPKVPESLISREVDVSTGKAILAASKYADECAALLTRIHGPEALRARIDIGAYDLLILGFVRHATDQNPLRWNGHTLVMVDGPPPH